MRLTARNYTLLTVTALFFLTASAQENIPKKYPSLLWEITGKGMTKPSYLYGTMHLSDKLVFNLPDSFFIAINRCDAVALELDMGGWMDDLMKSQEARENLVITSSSRTSSFYRSAFALNIPKENDLKSLLQFNPSISNNLLYRTSRGNSDYQEDNYLDIFIFQAGKKLNKKIIGLENYKRSEELYLQSIREDEFGEEENEELREQKRLRLRALRGENDYDDLLETAYRKGDLDLLDSVGRLMQSAGFLKYMLDERNFIMADRMDSVMRATPLFTGVGASHLPGENGVIEILRRKGYSVRPVSSVKSDIKSKNAIDETRYPTQFSSHYSSDSSFSVSLPGKLYEIRDGAGSGYYLHNDMNNGSYYCVQRIPHFGKLTGRSQDYILKSIDSLVFENIPGKLLSKKEIKSANGYPGIEILNKTAKGDVQRHQVFVSPHEIFAFKMHGIQEYVKKGTEADQFFSSIRFHEYKQDPAEYQSPFGYKAMFTGIRNACSVTSFLNSSLQQEIVQATDPADGKYFLIIASSLYDFEYIEDDTFELNMLAERLSLEANKKIVNRNFHHNNGILSLRFTLESLTGPGIIHRGEIVISGPDYYFLCTSGDSLAAENFFSSFKITAKKYKTPFSQVKDTSLFFTVSAQEVETEYTALVKERNHLGRYAVKKSKDDKEKEIYLPKRESRMYRSPDTREKVFVEFRKFSMYFQEETMEKFWKSRVETLSDDGELKVSREKSFTSGNLQGYDLLLTDTGSSRGILVRMLTRCGVQHMLKAVIDTVKGPEGFVKTFFDTFTPADTCIGIDVLSNKLDDYFFAKLYSSDTTESKKAKGATAYVKENMLPVNFLSLVKAVNDPGFHQLLPKYKKDLVSCFEKIKTTASLKELQLLYSHAADSVDVQLAILKVAAKMKTTEGARTFIKLLKEDVPVTTSDYSITEIFIPFRDSLELARELFPEILRYTKYPEYTNAIYRLLAQAVEAKLVKPKAYGKMLDYILVDAGYELKKYISDKDRDKKPYRYSYSSSENNAADVYDDLNTRQQKLYNYFCLLAPFYESGDVKKFFTKAITSSRSDRFKAIVYGQLLANEAKVPDTVSAYYSSSPQGRIYFYKILSKHGQLKKFDKRYLSQEPLVVSQLFTGNEDFEKDTLALLTVHRVSYNNKEGNVWIFKVRPKDKKIWKLAYSGVHPSDTLSVGLNPRFTKTNFSFETEEQMKKETDALLRKIRIDSRKRASLKDFENTEGGYYDYLDGLLDRVRHKE